MADTETSRTSFVDQIVEKTLEELLEREEFDEETLKRLSDLAHIKGLSDSASVVKALMGVEEG